jgi:hypothetical protein
MVLRPVGDNLKEGQRMTGGVLLHDREGVIGLEQIWPADLLPARYGRPCPPKQEAAAGGWLNAGSWRQIKRLFYLPL